MKLLTSVLLVSASLSQALGALPDVITTDANNLLLATGRLADAISPLPVSGPVDNSLVLHFDQASLSLNVSLTTAISDISIVDPTPFTPEDAAQFFDLVTLLRNKTLGMMSELQTKIAFRNSFSPVALADLAAQSKGFQNYERAFNPLILDPVKTQVDFAMLDILFAYSDALRFFGAS